MKPFSDPELPGLATATDLDAVLELLREALPECREGLEITGGNIVDVRYQREGSTWILYRLKVRRAGGRSAHQFLSAQLFRGRKEPAPLPADLLERFRKHRETVLRTPLVWLPQIGMALYTFPIDTSLPWLFEALDPLAMRKHLNRLWARRGVRVASVEVRPLGYTPQARAAFFYEVLCESRETGAPELRRLIGKMHAKKSAARLFAGSWALWRAAQEAGGRVNLAPPVGYLGLAGLTLQEQIRGERLGGLASAAGFVKRVRQAAAMLAGLHRLAIPLTTRRKPEDEAEVVQRWSGVLAAIRPDLKARVERLRDRLAAELCARVQVTGPVHGDFHHTNVLVQDHTVAIIDLDEMAHGDPMLDVGRFLASLRIPALRAFGGASGLARAGEAFLAAYLKRAPGDERRVRLFEASSLVTAAASSFRIQRANWREEVEVLLDEAERTLSAALPAAALPATVLPSLPPSRTKPEAGGAAKGPTAGAARAGAAAAGAEPAAFPPVGDPLRWALDGTYLQAALDPQVLAVYGAQIESCRAFPLGKSTPPDRIRYELRGRLGGEKWSRTLQGIPWRTHGGRGVLRRLEALRGAALGSPGTPLLPRPVAYLRQISLMVWEAPSGTRFSSLLGTSGAAEAAARVGRALAALHGIEVSLDSSRPLAHELGALGRRVRALEAGRPDRSALARQLLEAFRGRTSADAGRLAPTLRTVHPHHILLGEQVALSRVEEVALSHPLLDAADFLARLELLGLKSDRRVDAARAAESFREAYRESSAAGGERLEAFEAAALLRLACSQAKTDPRAALVDRLLERAAARLPS